MMPTVREQGSEFGWHRVTSDHFVIESNVDDRGFLDQTAADFETLRSTFLAVPYLGKNPPEGRCRLSRAGFTRGSPSS